MIMPGVRLDSHALTALQSGVLPSATAHRCEACCLYELQYQLAWLGSQHKCQHMLNSIGPEVLRRP